MYSLRKYSKISQRKSGRALYAMKIILSSVVLEEKDYFELFNLFICIDNDI